VLSDARSLLDARSWRRELQRGGGGGAVARGELRRLVLHHRPFAVEPAAPGSGSGWGSG